MEYRFTFEIMRHRDFLKKKYQSMRQCWCPTEIGMGLLFRVCEGRGYGGTRFSRMTTVPCSPFQNVRSLKTSFVYLKIYTFLTLIWKEKDTGPAIGRVAKRRRTVGLALGECRFCNGIRYIIIIYRIFIGRSASIVQRSFSPSSPPPLPDLEKCCLFPFLGRCRREK